MELRQINDLEFTHEGHLFSCDMNADGAVDLWFHRSVLATPMLIGEAQFPWPQGSKLTAPMDTLYNRVPTSQAFALPIPWDAALRARDDRPRKRRGSETLNRCSVPNWFPGTLHARDVGKSAQRAVVPCFQRKTGVDPGRVRFREQLLAHP